MFKKLLIIAVVIGGIYMFLQIPFVSEYVDGIKNDILEKKDNVVEEYGRVKDKVDSTVDKVVEVKEGVEGVVDTVSETADKVGEMSDKVGELFTGVEGEEGEESGEPVQEECTDEQKAAEICTMDYNPVCGDDGVTYGNACGACASGNVNTYVAGEC